MEYEDAEKEIRDSVIRVSNKYELGKKDTVAILTYLIHDVLSIREEARLEESAGTAHNNASLPCQHVFDCRTCNGKLKCKKCGEEFECA